jgi:hypothetical protein
VPDAPFQLHDAMLVRLDYVWHTRRLLMILRRGGELAGTWALEATGVTTLSCSSRRLWGPSDSINEVRGPIALDGGGARITVEVQSGDEILVDAERFELVRHDDDTAR